MPPRRVKARHGNPRGELAAEPETSTTALPVRSSEAVTSGTAGLGKRAGFANLVPYLPSVAGPRQ
jgi:hypothetical protein